MILRIYCLIAMVLFSLAWVPVRAETDDRPNVVDCKLTEMETDVRPDPKGTPTPVAIGLRLVDVTDIADVSQTITSDFLLVQVWTDSRLAPFEGCRFDLSEVWTPGIDILNSGRVFPRLPSQVEVLKSGEVRYLQRYQGALVFPYQAYRFPFDKHDIILTVISIDHGLDDVVFIIEKNYTGRVEAYEFNVPDWNISSTDASIESQFFDIYGKNVSRYDFRISVDRRSGYYVWKVILPLVLIVAMSWTVFWVDPMKFGPQIGTSATSMLTLIAYQFLIGSTLPHLSYFTTLDKFIAGSTILVFLALMESVTTSYLVAKEKNELAQRLDRASRWAFPSAFLAVSGFVFLVE